MRAWAGPKCRPCNGSRQRSGSGSRNSSSNNNKGESAQLPAHARRLPVCKAAARERHRALLLLQLLLLHGPLLRARLRQRCASCHGWQQSRPSRERGRCTCRNARRSRGRSLAGESLSPCWGVARRSRRPNGGSAPPQQRHFAGRRQQYAKQRRWQPPSEPGARRVARRRTAAEALSSGGKMCTRQHARGQHLRGAALLPCD